MVGAPTDLPRHARRRRVLATATSLLASSEWQMSRQRPMLAVSTAVAMSVAALPSAGARGPATAPAWSQPARERAVTLAELMRAARQHARRVAISRGELALARAQVLRASASLLPSLAATGALLRNQYSAIATLPAASGSRQVTILPNNQLDAQVTLGVPLVDASAWARRAQSRRDVLVADATMRATVEDVQLTMVRLYAQAMAAQSRLRSAKRTEQAARKDLAVIAARRSAGTVTELVVARAQLERHRARQLIVDTGRVLLQTLRAIGTLAGRKPPARVAVLAVQMTKVLPLRTRADKGELRRALRSKPELRQARAALASTRASISAAWLGLLPSVVLAASEHFTNATGFAGRVASYQLSASLRWTFDLTRVAEIRTQRAQRSLALQKLHTAEDDARDALANARLDVRSGTVALKIAREAEAVAGRAAKIAHAQFALGAGLQSDVIDAERDLVRAEADRAQAEADLLVARHTLRRARGEPLAAATHQQPQRADIGQGLP
ncbi:MAG: TolC family protein [Myxococcales bacterium]|nr:TolC family protein [Myxococcales bacterium]